MGDQAFLGPFALPVEGEMALATDAGAGLVSITALPIPLLEPVGIPYRTKVRNG